MFSVLEGKGREGKVEACFCKAPNKTLNSLPIGQES
jgi:hypothetical protein